MDTSRRERRFRCYKSSQKILLVGEGDFSFSACLAQAFRTAKNMVASSYLGKDWLIHKHWSSVPHLDLLDRLGGLLLYEVDVHNMDTHPALKNMKFDVIVYNFPHAGHYHYLRERDLVLIEMHRELVGAYFKSASKMLNEGGEVHLRHREDPPYDSWNVVSLAHEAGLKLKEKEEFLKSDYPGYHNKRGGDIQTNKSFPILCAFTFKFALDLPKVVDQHPKRYDVNKYHNDLLKKDEVVKALKMKDQVLDEDIIDSLYLKDIHNINDEVHVSKMTDDQNYLNSDDEVNDDFLKDEMDNTFIKKVEANDDLFVHKNDEVVHLPKSNDLDVHAIEMNNHFLEEHAKNNGVEVDLTGNDEILDDRNVDVSEIHNDVRVYERMTAEDDVFQEKTDKLNDDDDDGDLLEKDKVHADLFLPTVGDDQTTIVEVNHDQDIDMKHLMNHEKDHANDHDLPKKENVHISTKYEVHCYFPKTDKLDNDHFNNDKVDNNDHQNNDDVCEDFNNIYRLDDDIDVLVPPKMKNDVQEHHVKNNNVDDLDAQMLEIKSLVEQLHIKNDVDEMIEFHEDNDLNEHTGGLSNGCNQTS